MPTQNQKQEFIGGLIAATFAKKGVEMVVEKALERVANKPATKMVQSDAPKAAPVVVDAVKEEVQARAEHTLDAEDHWRSRNIWGVFFGLMGEMYILWTFWTDNIPQDFQMDVVPHLMVIGGLLTPLYSRFVAKKPLFR